MTPPSPANPESRKFHIWGTGVKGTAAQKKRLEQLRESERASERAEWHREQRARVRAQPAWKLPNFKGEA